MLSVSKGHSNLDLKLCVMCLMLNRHVHIDAYHLYVDDCIQYRIYRWRKVKNATYPRVA